eukprot:303263_1
MRVAMGSNNRCERLSYMNQDTLFLSNESLEFIDNDIISFKILGESAILDIMNCISKFNDYSLISGIALDTRNQHDVCVFFESSINEMYIFHENGMFEKCSILNYNSKSNILNFKLLFWMKKHLYCNINGIVNIHNFDEKEMADDDYKEEDTDVVDIINIEMDNDLVMTDYVNENDNQNLESLILPSLHLPELPPAPSFAIVPSMGQSITPIPIPMHHAPPPPLQSFTPQQSSQTGGDNLLGPSYKMRKLGHKSKVQIRRRTTPHITSKKKKRKKATNTLRGEWNGQIETVKNKLLLLGRDGNEAGIKIVLATNADVWNKKYDLCNCFKINNKFNNRKKTNESMDTEIILY